MDDFYFSTIKLELSLVKANQMSSYFMLSADSYTPLPPDRKSGLAYQPGGHANTGLRTKAGYHTYCRLMGILTAL